MQWNDFRKDQLLLENKKGHFFLDPQGSFRKASYKRGKKEAESNIYSILYFCFRTETYTTPEFLSFINKK